MNKKLNSLTSKIILGTVQFGQVYGVANTRGRILEDEIFDILQYAQYVGINTLDTALNYGCSERIIGHFLTNKENCFNIISKLPSLEQYPDGRVEELLATSLKSLNRNKIFGYLIHKFSDYLTHEELWGQMTSFKSKGIIEKIGFSLYYPEEIEILLRKKVEFDVVQLPYSIFDRRFEKYFEALKANQVDIYARSAFLQGMAFLDPDQLQGTLMRAKDQIGILKKLSRETNISISAICLNFILSNQNVDKVVIGIDSLDHLKTNVESLEHFEELNRIKSTCDEFMIEDEDILNPSKWELAYEHRS